jgi:hypothetical protein
VGLLEIRQVGWLANPHFTKRRIDDVAAFNPVPTAVAQYRGAAEVVGRGSLPIVNIAPVADQRNVNYTLLVIHNVDDAIITDSPTAIALPLARQHLVTGGLGIFRQPSSFFTIRAMMGLSSLFSSSRARRESINLKGGFSDIQIQFPDHVLDRDSLGSLSHIAAQIVCYLRLEF